MCAYSVISYIWRGKVSKVRNASHHFWRQTSLWRNRFLKSVFNNLKKSWKCCEFSTGTLYIKVTSIFLKPLSQPEIKRFKSSSQWQCVIKDPKVWMIEILWGANLQRNTGRQPLLRYFKDWLSAPTYRGRNNKL